MELKTDSSITNIFYLSLVGAMKQRTEELANPDPPNFISFEPLLLIQANFVDLCFIHMQQEYL